MPAKPRISLQARYLNAISTGNPGIMQFVSWCESSLARNDSNPTIWLYYARALAKLEDPRTEQMYAHAASLYNSGRDKKAVQLEIREYQKTRSTQKGSAPSTSVPASSTTKPANDIQRSRPQPATEVPREHAHRRSDAKAVPAAADREPVAEKTQGDLAESNSTSRDAIREAVELNRAGRTPEALDTLQKYIDANPDDCLAARTSRVHILLGKQRLEEAAVDYETIINMPQQEKTRVHNMIELALVSMKLKNFTRTLELVDALVAAAPQNPQVKRLRQQANLAAQEDSVQDEFGLDLEDDEDLSLIHI